LGLSLEKFSIRRTSSFLAINERLLSYGKLFNPSRFTLIRAGVDLKNFQPKLNIRKEIRHEYGVGKHEFLLFFMGYLYNFSGLIEVLDSLKTGNFPEFKLLIVGDGEQRSKLEELIDRYSMHHIVTLLRWQSYENIPSLISAADICLLPAYPNKIMQDIVPIKLYEYLAMEKPVVTTPLAGVYSEFGNNSGVIYALSSEDVMKKCKHMIIHEEVEKLGKKGRKFIEEKCDWNKLVKTFLQEMYDVVAG
jgi:glycosyltransferase involved in cell wall biosynthesis